MLSSNWDNRACARDFSRSPMDLVSVASVLINKNS